MRERERKENKKRERLGPQKACECSCFYTGGGVRGGMWGTGFSSRRRSPVPQSSSANDSPFLEGKEGNHKKGIRGKGGLFFSPLS